jgi:predicted secreted hydrolase
MAALALGGLAALLALGADEAPAQSGWISARPGYAWSFPEDHGSHPGYRTEWWYFTGDLEERGNPERRLTFQLTLFRVGLLPEAPAFDSSWSSANMVMGHAALLDLSSGRRVYSETLQREVPFLGGFGVHPDPLLAWVAAPPGSGGRWTVRRAGAAFDVAMTDESRGLAFSLRTRPRKALVFQGPGGFSRKGEGPGAASQYYSFTRLGTEGTVVLDGETLEVEGECWMDHEFSSSQLEGDQVGWDWLSLRLDDGRDLMLYHLRREDGGVDFRRATLVEADGRTRYLGPEEWSAEPTRVWRSPESGAPYPVEWRVRVPSARLDLLVEPDRDEQENRSELPSAPTYWEGGVTARDPEGSPVGRGFLELTGYGEGSRPPV